MKIWMRAVLAAALAAGASQAAWAGPVVDANIARAEEKWGVEGSLGYRFGILGFAITPSVGAFATRSDEERYLEQPDPAGGTRCQDSQTGDYVRDLRCENADLKAFGRVEATYAIPFIAEVGLGVRVTKDDTTPYGTVALPIFPAVKLKGNVGDDYYGLGLRVGF